MKKTLTLIALVSSTLFSYAQKKVTVNISIGNTAILVGEGNQKSYLNPIIKASVFAKISQKTQIGFEVGNNWFKTKYSKVTLNRKYISLGLKVQTKISDRIRFVLGGGYMLNYDTQRTYANSSYKSGNINMYYANTGISIALFKDKKTIPIFELLPIAYIGKSNVTFGVQASLGLSF